MAEQQLFRVPESRSVRSRPKPVQKEIQKQIQLSENALRVLEKRYLLKDRESQNPIETSIQMFERVAKVVASSDALYGASPDAIKATEVEFYNIMTSLDFLPNSPTFTGAGTKLGQLSACFVLPVEDDMHSILKTQYDMGMIHKSGGGTGFSFSRLRPLNDVVGSTGGISCGPLGFMQMYNDTTEQIKQGGTRRGANMGILHVNHPDIMDFIEYKSKEGKLSNFNISVAVDDKFMKAVVENKDYDLINPHNKKIVKKNKAKEIFDKIIHFAWLNGEPGMIFLDKINIHNPTPALGEIEATNPCGEQPLLPYESCNLGSINLSHMIEQSADKNVIDWDKLKKTVKTAIHFLDNVIDANKFPIPEIEKMTKANRKVGLGVMGLADLLFQLEIPYNSQAGLEVSAKVAKFIQENAHLASKELAEKRGVFPNFAKSRWATPADGKIKMRNASTTTIAPTGTLSIIASASSGIEPIFALVYTKTVMDGTALVEINPHFIEYARRHGFYSEGLIKQIKARGNLENISEVPEAAKKIFVTASQIAPEDHVKMQATFQKYVDNAISKTINFPNSATQDNVKNAYLLAYRLGCKGITIYRDGSRQTQVLTHGAQTQTKETPVASEKIMPRARPPIVRGATYKTKTAYGNLYVTINEDPNGAPFEIFAHIGKTGGFFAAKVEAISRLISLALRAGIKAEEVIDQLKGIRGPSPVWTENGLILSIPDAMAKILEQHLKKDQVVLDLKYQNNHEIPILQENKNIIADSGHAPACPECHNMLEFGEGCLKCPVCGFSKCG